MNFSFISEIFRVFKNNRFSDFCKLMNNIKCNPAAITNYCDSKKPCMKPLPLCITQSTNPGRCNDFLSIMNGTGMLASEPSLFDHSITMAGSSLFIELYWLISFYSPKQTEQHCETVYTLSFASV